MKKMFLFILAAGAFTACQQAKSTTEETTVTEQTTTTVVSPNAGVISFEHGMYNFGTITQGDKVHYDFKFKNTGKSPLIITNASATCGCTVPEKPKEPVKPGETGVIKVVFNSTGKIGMQDKVVTIESNGNPSKTEVHLIGEVKEPVANL
jgi:hypothetical protein